MPGAWPSWRMRSGLMGVRRTHVFVAHSFTVCLAVARGVVVVAVCRRAQPAADDPALLLMRRG